eukprot:226662_1
MASRSDYGSTSDDEMHATTMDRRGKRRVRFQIPPKLNRTPQNKSEFKKTPTRKGHTKRICTTDQNGNIIKKQTPKKNNKSQRKLQEEKWMLSEKSLNSNQKEESNAYVRKIKHGKRTNKPPTATVTQPKKGRGLKVLMAAQAKLKEKENNQNIEDVDIEEDDKKICDDDGKRKVVSFLRERTTALLNLSYDLPSYYTALLKLRQDIRTLDSNSKAIPRYSKNWTAEETNIVKQPGDSVLCQLRLLQHNPSGLRSMSGINKKRKEIKLAKSQSNKAESQ